MSTKLLRNIQPVDGLILGKVYEAYIINSDGVDYAHIHNEDGRIEVYRMSRFEEFPDFESLVRSRKKNPIDLLNEYTALKADLDHMLIGLNGEVGEIADCIKKHTKYNQPLDLENLEEEIGDTLFYLEGMCQAVGLTLKECMNSNIVKLSERYSSGSYSDRQAHERADKRGVR